MIAPLSVLHNWQREAVTFAPDLCLILLADAPDLQLAKVGPNDVVVASWDRMVRRSEELNGLRWQTVVLDEAQAMKNAVTKRAQAAFALNAEFRIALTGTPVENRTSELWSLMRAAVPGLLFGSWDEFRDRFAGPIERDGDPWARQSLARLVRPFLLRRLKRDVAPELPARTEIELEVVLSAPERTLLRGSPPVGSAKH